MSRLPTVSVPRRLPLLAACLALGAGALASGCTPTSYKDADEALGTVETFLGTCADGRPSEVADTLNPTGRNAYIAAGGKLSGCRRILQLAPTEALALTSEDFSRASAELRHEDGARAVVDVKIAGATKPLELSYGYGFWRIEGPH